MTRTPRSPARGLWLAALLAGLLVAGCDESGTDVQSGPITGTWVAQLTGGNLYVVITDDSLVYYTEATAEDCADRYAYTLEPLGGDRYRLTSTVNTATLESTITATQNELTWDTGSGTALFQRADGVDPSTINVCAGGGDDPALVCAELPVLPLAQDVADSLTQADALERDRYYDVYGFQPAEPLTATISLTSSEFDAYLYVYEADGTLLGENDDVSAETVDAGLTLELVPVCYRIEVTTFDTGVTGDYTLRIE